MLPRGTAGSRAPPVARLVRRLLRSGEQRNRIVYTAVHWRSFMETLKVGIREFREKLASYLLESEVPVAITRHGDTVGYYIPARRKRTDAERTALKQAAARVQEMLAAEGISEEEILKDFKQWRAGGRK